jgi:hypothetical protein
MYSCSYSAVVSSAAVSAHHKHSSWQLAGGLQNTAQAAAVWWMKRSRRARDGAGEQPAPGQVGRRRRVAAEEEDEEIDSDFSSDEDVEGGEGGGGASSADESPDETADEKRLRLAKQYLRAVRADETEGVDGEDVDAAIENRLTRDVLESKGRYTRHLAERLDIDLATRRSMRGHQLAVTCVALAKDGATAYTGSKDCAVISWDVEAGARRSKLVDADAKKGRAGQILAVSYLPLLIFAVDLRTRGNRVHARPHVVVGRCCKCVRA